MLLNTTNSRPLYNKTKGKILNDKELVDFALKKIDEYVDEHKKLPNIDGRFVQFLRDYKNEIKDTPSTDYKNKYVTRQLGGDNYDMIVGETNKRNKKQFRSK